MDTHRTFEFGPFHLDVRQRTLLRNGEQILLKPKALDLLIVLVENRDRVVEKEELMRRVWPDSAVEENNLTVQKRALVAALGDGYIQTVPRRGYRFLADVRDVQSGGAPTSEASAALQQSLADESLEDDAQRRSTQESASRQQRQGETGIDKTTGRRKSFAVICLVALLVVAGAFVVWRQLATRSEHRPAERVQVRSPSDEAEVMRVVKESQIYETLGIYTHPEAFDRGQLSRFWVSVEQGGKATAAIEAAVERLRKRGWRYADDSRVEVFDFRYVRIFSPRDYAEVGTSERWYVPTVWAETNVRVENRNVYLGIYDVDYTLRKIDGRWLIEDNSTPRPKSDGK